MGGLAGAPLIQLIEKYIFADWQFLVFLFILIVIDTLTGIAKHWKKKTVSSRGFGSLFTKVATYIIFLITVHILKHFTVGGSANSVFAWVDSFAYSAVVVREVVSVCENLTAIHPDIIPAAFTKRLKQVTEESSLIKPEDHN